ncbi:hypothetical protein BCV72DRAFT_302187 [Rhizopus microsporus var. microsporus]|uniref:Uncharacterized protein n=2 Tax=Rhizopus microsporus TaxID=58291 RepID=A0A2G4SRX4_RHIZD|nr:uncharacterized protein RHIMIDRAFT_238945 [Rhizopus microsporus ATCC 52813]ORE10050.1 hypothetical protein BCV72DRAFT_302187 [Rhizopus microsporus var. microsporus]PHZ11510.1 hypothetical protein RHIMIDRAFT_238945 [Rhizopus microsporus ATCC 52813]
MSSIWSDNKLSQRHHDMLESKVQQFAGIIVGFIVKFLNGYFYFTNGDVFAHDHVGLNDCAYGICTVNEVVSQQDIVNLFSSFAETSVYLDIQKHVRSNATNFQELHLTSSSLGNGFGYSKFLIETAKLIEEKVNEVGRYRAAATLGPTFMRKLLEIMKSELKDELSKQSDSIVKITLNKENPLLLILSSVFVFVFF